MNDRTLTIDEIASIKNKYHEEHPTEDIPREPEPSDEESDLFIILYKDKEHYQDLDGHIYEITKDKQIGKLVKNLILK
jgi:hypothetical protein|tara:strand:+ start:278 stop:511 length:234 start_codon:yes stop_codon:yes gene_type:complete